MGLLRLTKKKNGGECQQDGNCVSDRCTDQLICAAKLEAGEWCMDNGDCVSGTCNLSSFVCLGPWNGDMCLQNGDCVSDRCTQTQQPICAAKLEAGARCQNNGDCVSGTCKFLGPVGSCVLLLVTLPL